MLAPSACSWCRSCSSYGCCRSSRSSKPRKSFTRSMRRPRMPKHDVADRDLIPGAPFGLLAEFETPEALVQAARRVRDAGYRDLDAFTPFPVYELFPLLR